MLPKDSPFLIAGHAVLDDFIDSKKQTIYRNDLGGGVCYGSLAVKSLGYVPKVITRVGGDFPTTHLNYMKTFAGVSLEDYVDRYQNTTRYRIDSNDSHRKLWLLAKCGDLTLEDFARAAEHFQGEALILNPVAGEVSLNVIRQIVGKFKYVFLDSQGFVRGFQPNTGLVFNTILTDSSALRGVFALKADREELFAWTGINDAKKAIKEILRFAKNLILTSGPGVVELYRKDGRVLRAKPLAIETTDTTGAGDIMLASFAVRYCETGNLLDSLEFATAASSLATQKIGVAKAILSYRDVISQIEKVRLR